MYTDYMLVKCLAMFLCWLLVFSANPVIAEGASSSIEIFLAEQKAKGSKANRLINEKSPYLLQHAFNPVDWFPWGEEAFQKARQENKLIFLSIGYSTCHWCHVMAHETFEHVGVASILNRHFISIKVDREERPDIDRTYMRAALSLNGQGGWPLSVFLTPNVKPFFVGTYFPPEDKFGLPGFISVLNSIQYTWENEPNKIRFASSSLTSAIMNQEAGKTVTEKPDQKILDKEFSVIAGRFDEKDAGFGSAPKFPRPVLFNFLLRYHARTGNIKALEMTQQTLTRMAQGGMYDQLGGGFHRYSVDSKWHVPHFEKMLYDQSQLAISYLEAYQISSDPLFAEIARQTLNYVLSDMTAPEGGFYSAEDADSPAPDNPKEKREGAYYVWTYDEIRAILGESDAGIFNAYYGVIKNGNVESDPQKEFVNQNILFRAQDISIIAKQSGNTDSAVRAALDMAKDKMRIQRSTRPRPHLDDKVITSWNGLMISAFAKGYQVLDDKTYLDAATAAADFIMTTLYNSKDGILMRRFRQGESGLDAQLTDYAILSQGLLDLYESSFNSQWLSHAIKLTEKQMELFYDTDHGGFFDNPENDANLLRTKEDYDGAMPAGNSVAAMNLLRLSQITGNKQWQEAVDKTFAYFSSTLQNEHGQMPQMLSALDYSLKKPRQIIIAGKQGSADTEQLLKEIYKRYLPNKIILLADGGKGKELLSTFLPFIVYNRMINGKATAYVCENFSCKNPVTDAGKLAEQLDL
jgi:uncharacterized protein YyaL (SSP411 family)